MAEGVGDLPKFDIRRAFPGLSFGTWQAAQASLEAAEPPSHTLIQCRDAHQIHLFQDMGKLISIKDKIYLFAGAALVTLKCQEARRCFCLTWAILP